MWVLLSWYWMMGFAPIGCADDILSEQSLWVIAHRQDLYSTLTSNGWHQMQSDSWQNHWQAVECLVHLQPVSKHIDKTVWHVNLHCQQAATMPVSFDAFAWFQQHIHTAVVHPLSDFLPEQVIEVLAPPVLPTYWQHAQMEACVDTPWSRNHYPVLGPNHAPEAAPVWQANRRKPRHVALTFDACSTPQVGKIDEKVIEQLRKYQVPATLFMGGHWAELHPQWVQDLAADPLFEIGNHTFTHPHMPQLSPAAMREELLWTQIRLFDLAGIWPKLFRPPYGEIDDRVVETADALGLTTVQFDVASGDPDKHLSSEHLIHWVLSRVGAGSIVVMHMNQPQGHTSQIIAPIVTQLRERGYQFCHVSELFDAN